jgi:hypothetical protein
MEQMQQPQPLDPQQARFMTIANLARRVSAGASNFYWIAALSVVNSFISAFGGGVNFVIGLGITQLVDALALLLAQEIPEGETMIKGVGLVLSLLIAGLFGIFGYFATKAHRWAFIAGMVLYGLDAILLLLFQDWLGFFFHLYFLWGLWNGLQALGQLQKLNPPQSNTVMDFPRNIGAP